MKRILIFLITLLPIYVFAQMQTFEQYKAEQQSKINKYKSDKQKDFDAYRQKLNAEYAAYMKQNWQEYKISAAKKRPQDQDPPKPTVKQDDSKTPTNEIGYKVVIIYEPYEEPNPVVPIETPAPAATPIFTFLFHDTPCSVHLSKGMRFTLPNISENAVADAWIQLSNSAYDDLIIDCLRLRNSLQLGDWGYIQLLQSLTQRFFESNTSNEATLLQMYILTQSGYNVRIARANERLILLVPFEEDIYNYSYIAKDGLKFYIIDKEKGVNSYHVFDRAFPKSQVASLRIQKTPLLTNNPTSRRTISSSRYPKMRVTINENKNLIDFYNAYPLSSKWDYYSKASLSEDTKSVLYPMLKKQLEGQTSLTAANMLLNFVQTAFEYQTDGQQFGYERPLFGDETLYYPYSDCEDRSILYSILVRELLGLEVVLLDYPGHIATAVRFPNDEYYGYYITMNGKKYTICDPTYINADAGECMPDYRNTLPDVVQIQ